MNAPRSGRRPLSDRATLVGSPTFDRRRFLVLAGGAAAGLALRPAEGWARKAAAIPSGLQPWSLADELPGNPVDAARALIGAAVLAPSEWNSQPWRFEVEGNSIRIVAEPRRSLPASDPDRRGMMIGLGAALENLLVAARSWGLRTTVNYLPRDGASPVVAEVTWSTGDPRRDRALFAAIPARRTNRREFDRRGIYPQNRTQLMAETMEGLQIHWLDDPARIASVADIVHEATRAQVQDARVQSEQFAWMRFDDDAEKRGDGVPIGALELGGPARWFAGRYFRPGSWFLRFGAEHAAGQAREQVKSAGALALVTVARRDDSQWLMCGQSFERLALRATHLGIAQQILSAPTESERFRGDLRREFRSASQEEPALLVRLGHARAPESTPRRAVSVVATFRNS